MIASDSIGDVLMNRLLLATLLSLSFTAHCSTIIESEQPKPLKPTGTLGTCSYKPRDTEQAYFHKLVPTEQVTGSFLQEYSIHGKKDKYVSWFAIVREVNKDQTVPNRYHLLLEQKYFDGMTDCHIMLVSVSGSGDFMASVDADGTQSIPLFSLIRVYGKVTEEAGGLPQVSADYIRVWPWFAFTLTDLGGTDHSNPKWRKLCKLCKSGRVYKPYPTEEYYLSVLGDPKDSALSNNGKQ